MIIYGKAMDIIKNGIIPYEEKYYGIALLYDMELITLEEYYKLTKVLEGLKSDNRNL